MTHERKDFAIHAFRAELEERMNEPEFNAKLAELLRPNVPTRQVVELFRGLLYKPETN